MNGSQPLFNPLSDVNTMSQRESEDSANDDLYVSLSAGLGAELNPDQLQEMVGRVKTGELSASDATQLLLAQSAANFYLGDISAVATADTGESLSALLDRLGTPPQDIVDQWCQQLCCAALVHQHQTAQPLPAIEPEQWSIDHQGNLIWNGFRFHSHSGQWPEPDQASLLNIHRFRESLLPPQAPIPLAGAGKVPAESATLAAESSAKRETSGEVRKQKSAVGTYVGGGLVAATMAVMAAIFVNADSDKPTVKKNESVVAQATPQTSTHFDNLGRGVTSETAPLGLSTAPIGGSDSSPAAAVSGELTTLSPSSDAGSEDVVGLDVSLDMSLDSIIPASIPAAEITASEGAEPDMTATAANSVDGESLEVDAMPTGLGEAATMDPLAEDDSPSPDEAPQATRTAEIAAVELPPARDHETSAKLLDVATKNPLTLEFPFPVNLTTDSAADSSETVIKDSRSEKQVALITSQDNTTRFQWTEQATRSSSSLSLVHGRIQAGEGVVFLRPLIESDALEFNFDRADIHPTWDLRGPIPPRITRLSVDVDLPKEVEIGWVEPIDPAELRRTRAVAIFKPEDGETIALGMRFDIRCSRKLSIRIRFAGRLDSQQPWQLVSQPMLDQFSDNVANQQTRVSGMITQADTMYSNAPSYRRREIRERQDVLENQADSLRELSRRIADFQGLVARMQAAAKLKIRVWVEWPDGTQQSLLVTT